MIPGLTELSCLRPREARTLIDVREHQPQQRINEQHGAGSDSCLPMP